MLTPKTGDEMKNGTPLSEVKSIPTKTAMIIADVRSLIEVAPIMAEYKRVMYKAYIEEGFSEDQALELCKI